MCFHLKHFSRFIFIQVRFAAPKNAFLSEQSFLRMASDSDVSSVSDLSSSSDDEQGSDEEPGGLGHELERSEGEEEEEQNQATDR